jgi:hypothetical protein
MTPFYKVNCFFGVLLLCWACKVSTQQCHDHVVLFLLHIQFSLYFGLEMIDHCIPYIFLNIRTFSKNMALLSAKTTMVGYRSGFLIYTLIKSTPYSLFK